MQMIIKDSSVAIGFARLAIRALESGDQPHEFLTWVSAINGELYNQKEIESRLSVGSPPDGDMQILGQYLSEYGIEAIVNADGMFAGVLIDQANRKLHVFRDKVGEKPLYYRLSDDHIEVMSENAFDDSYIPDHESYTKKALLGFIPDKSKYANGVQRVSPGSYFTFDLDTFDFQEKRYWEWPTRPNRHIGNSITDLGSFKKFLYASVESRLAADVPISSLLSGGVDSAVITKVAQDILGYPIPAFTLGFKDSNYDESRIAKLSAQSIGCELEIVEIDSKTLSRLTPLCIKSMTEPILDSACLSLFALAQVVSKNFKVALTGDGGDELFQGYSLFENLRSMELAGKTPKLSGLLLQLTLALPAFRFRESYISQTMKIERVISILEHSEVNPIALALSPLGGTKLIDNVMGSLSSDFSNSLRFSPEHFSARYLENYYRAEVLPHLYLEKADRMSMIHGLELRAPFLSPQLIEFASQVSQDQIQTGKRKILIRQFAEEFLPGEVLDAKKHGFSPPLLEIVKHLEEPDWNLEYLGLTEDGLSRNWELALAGNQNASYAAWATLVLNSYSDKVIS